MTHDDVLVMLRGRVDECGGSVTLAARHLGISTALLSATLAGADRKFHRAIGRTVLRALGLRAVPSYEPIRAGRPRSRRPR